MKKENIAIIISVFLIAVIGIQAYAMFRMSQRLDQLAEQSKPELGANITVPAIPKPPVLPKASPNDDFFADRAWNPYEEMQHMQDQMQQMFSDSMSRFHMNTPMGSLNKSPEVDLEEKADNYVVTVNAPGADESSIKVKLDDRLLSISIKTEQAKDDSTGKDDKYRYRERFVGEFQRLLTLPGPTDAAKMKTEYRNGVLTITVPKA